MYPRPRNLIGFAVLVALAVLTWLFGRPAVEDAPRQGRGDDTNAAYYLRNATMLGTDVEGRVYYQMVAREIEQSVEGDELLFHGLQIDYQPEFEVNWSLTAAEGRATRGEDVFDLSEGVSLTNNAVREGESTVIETASLTLDTAQSMATTPGDVVLLHGRTTFRGAGLTADLSRDQLTLHSDVVADVAP